MSNEVLHVCSFLNAQDNNKVGIWDSLCYLVSRLILERDIKEISVENISNHFKNYYGFSIPMYPMKELFNKMYKAGYLSNNEFNNFPVPNFHKMKELVLKTKYGENIFENLVNHIQLFVNEKYQIQKSKDEIEKVLLIFLQKYQHDLLNGYLDPNLIKIDIDEDQEKDLYIINDFFFKCLSERNEISNEIINIVISVIHLSSIFYNKSNNTVLGKKPQIFLDTRVILRLLGFEGDFRKKEYEAFIEELINRGCNLFIFENHYQEIDGILEDCLYWLSESDKYNPRYASPTLRHFVEKKYDRTDVTGFRANLDILLDKYSIKKKSFNYEDSDDDKYNIDESKLHEIIISEYSKNNESFDAADKDEIIWNDIKAISSIFRYRKGEKYNSFKKVKFVFITVNSALARANRLLSKENDENYKFHECMTDSFYGTYLWLSSNTLDKSFISKQILASSYDYLKINPKVQNEFLNLVERKKDKYSEEQLAFMKESEICKELVSEKTFNDSRNVTDSLPDEILASFINRVKNDVSKEFNDKILSLNEQNSYMEQKKSEAESKFDADEVKINSTKRQLQKDSDRETRLILIPIGILALIIIPVASNFCSLEWLKWCLIVLSILISAFFNFSGISLKSIGKIISKMKYEKKIHIYLGC